MSKPNSPPKKTSTPKKALQSPSSDDKQVSKKAVVSKKQAEQAPALSFTSVSQIKEIGQGVISDKKNMNNLVKLTSFLEELFPLSNQTHRKVALQTIESLSEIFTFLFNDEKTIALTVSEMNQKDVVVCDVSGEKSVQKKEYKKWIFDQYTSFTKYLTLFAVHYFSKFADNEEEIEKTVKIILSLAKLEVQSASGSVLAEMERERSRLNTIVSEGPFGMLIYHIVTDRNGGTSSGSSFLVDYLTLEYIHRYHDLRFFTYIGLTQAIRKIRSKKKQVISYSQLFENILALIDGMPKIESIGRFYLFDGYDSESDDEEMGDEDDEGMEDEGEEGGDAIPADFMFDDELGDLNALKLPSSEKNAEEKTTETNEEDEKEENQENSLLDPDVHAAAFSNFWLSFLLLPEMSRNVYERILRKMSDEIIPQFENPFLLNDFISSSFDQGGLVALLSIKSLFILISEYNLVYEQFYQKLYSIVELNLFTMDYREEFFELFDTFMKSTHLPEYLVAAFIKKFARLALFAPAYACNYILAIIFNLISRHPQISFLVQHDETEPKYLSRIQKRLLKEKNPELFVEEEKIIDPFDENEKDPKACKAMQSQLWEIETLVYHSNQSVSKMAKDIRHYFLVGYPQFDIKKFTKVTTESMFLATSSEKKKHVKLTNVEASLGLFKSESDSFVYSIFDF